MIAGRTAVISAAAMLLPVLGAAQDAPLAVNYVSISPSLSTAGQPEAETLGGLVDRGYGLVINLAPPQSQGAVADESLLLGEDGIAYVNIPVDWQRPTQADFDLFSAVMSNAGDRKVLVHCQMNMRASVFTFLYQVVHEGMLPEEAFDAVRTVWIPSEQWADFGDAVLEENGIAFRFPAAE